VYQLAGWVGLSDRIMAILNIPTHRNLAPTKIKCIAVKRKIGMKAVQEEIERDDGKEENRGRNKIR
jgi:hypothetical protein